MAQLTLDREQLAWAAGLWDGEGYLSVRSSRKGGPLSKIQLGLGMTDRAAVERFQHAVGGVGRIREDQQGNYRPVFRWDVYNYEHVQFVLALLWTWLSGFRRAQAEEKVSLWLAHPHRKSHGPRLKEMI